MNNEQENLLQLIRGMARSASPSSFYHQACPACHAKPCCLGRSGEQRRRVTKPVLSGAEGTLRIIEQCKSASAIYLKGVLHAVSFIEGRYALVVDGVAF